MFKALKEKGTPGGMALGNATGDSGWTHWLIWAFGGTLVDKNNKVVIDSPETIKALEYAKELYANFIPGTLSWLDPNNNKAFLDGQISVTNNGISIYYAAKNSPDPKVKEMAADINHASFPIGPVGVPTESHLFFNQMIMKYTKYPQAAKEFLRFMMEAEQFDAWLQGGGGYVSQPLRAYEKNPIWTSDPKNTPYRDCDQEPAARRATPASWATHRPARWPTSSSPTWWPRRPAARRRRRKRPSARRSAPSATTRSDMRDFAPRHLVAFESYRLRPIGSTRR